MTPYRYVSGEEVGVVTFGVVGCGVMGGAFARHLARKGTVFLNDRSEQKGQALAEEIGGKWSDLKGLVQEADLIVIAVKPKDLAEMVQTVDPDAFTDKIVMSVLAAVTTKLLKRRFPGAEVVRLMPNLALMCGKGTIGIAKEGVTKRVRKRVDECLEGMGSILWLPEAKIEALTALNASGIGIFFALIESAIQAGVEMGLSDEESQELSLSGLEGAAALLRSSDVGAGLWKTRVASPGGTTQAGLKEMERLGVEAGLKSAILASYRRAIEMRDELAK